MDKKQIEQKVKEILADRLDIDINKIELDSDLVDDLGMDSFASVETMFEIEEEFGIEIPEKDLAEVKVVRDIVKYISSRISEKR